MLSEEEIKKIKKELLIDDEFKQKLFVSYFKDFETFKKKKEQSESESECSNPVLLITSTVLSFVAIIIIIVKTVI